MAPKWFVSWNMQGLPLSSQATEHNSQVPTRFSRWYYPSTSVCERWLSQPHHTCLGASNNCRAHLNFRDVTMEQSGCIKTDKIGVLARKTEALGWRGCQQQALLPAAPSPSLSFTYSWSSPHFSLCGSSASDGGPGGSRLTLA